MSLIFSGPESPPGVLLGPLGGLLRALGASRALFDGLLRAWNALGTLLEGSWRAFGAILRALGAVLDALGALLDAPRAPDPPD